MGAIASQITSLTMVTSAVYLDTDQRKHQSSASLAFVRGIHWRPVNSPSQMASNAKNVSIWWRNHIDEMLLYESIVTSVKNDKGSNKDMVHDKKGNTHFQSDNLSPMT